VQGTEPDPEIGRPVLYQLKLTYFALLPEAERLVGKKDTKPQAVGK
jgi:hypothetical protein